MNSWRPLINLLALAAAFSGCASTFAQESNSRETLLNPVAEWVAKYREDNQTSNDQYQLFYKKLFELPEYDGKGTQLDSSHPSILIQAAWRSIVHQVPAAFDDSTPNLQCETSNGLFGRRTIRFVKADKQAVCDFVELIRQKTGASPPDWWVDMLVHLTWREQREFLLPPPNENPYRPTNTANLFLPIDTELVADSKSLTFKLNDRSFSIPKTEFDTKTYNQPTGVVAFFHKNTFLVTKHHDWGNNHDLRCYDVETNKLKWNSNVIGSLDTDFLRSVEPTWVEITASENSGFFVFGACAGGFYIQGFNADSGESIFRFSTMYNPCE